MNFRIYKYSILCGLMVGMTPLLSMKKEEVKSTVQPNEMVLDINKVADKVSTLLKDIKKSKSWSDQKTELLKQAFNEIATLKSIAFKNDALQAQADALAATIKYLNNVKLPAEESTTAEAKETKGETHTLNRKHMRFLFASKRAIKGQLYVLKQLLMVMALTANEAEKEQFKMAAESLKSMVKSLMHEARGKRGHRKVQHEVIKTKEEAKA